MLQLGVGINLLRGGNVGPTPAVELAWGASFLVWGSGLYMIWGSN